MTSKTIKIYPACEYPSQWDDLIDQKRKTIATIYTLEEGKQNNLKEGITKGKDGIYDVVVGAKEINNEIVRDCLKKLSKITKKKYKFRGKLSFEDKIIAFANKLMKPLEKYGNSRKGYDFSVAKTAKQKAEIIKIWIGEILYETLTYKDVVIIKSLTETILAEVEDLVRE